MRTRLVLVLEKDDRDEPMDAVVRRFWSRGSNGGSHREPASQAPSSSCVTELASWVRARQARTRR